ncbi:MAG: DUF2786 domain-containing protein [Parachlamydiaceae bacterium]|nr:DUF2786 domain-containing protein [Parachlamydiaceae bacterium]
MNVKVHGNRFWNRWQTASYPISVVIYNTHRRLGYFNPDFYEMGFHECLIHSSKEQLRNIIRHELAHYMMFIEYEGLVQPHGPEFRAFCLKLGWGEEVYRATTALEGQSDFESEKSSIFRKIQKLMALTESSNKNEAEQAMIKSQQLLLKHNLESMDVVDDEGEKVYLKRILKQPKENAKMRSIAKILETFFVNTIYSRGSNTTYLEISGSAINIEIAEHVAEVLHRELEKLWEQAKKQHIALKGMTAKNSFFLGVAKGYCIKVQALKKEYQSDVMNGLMVIEKQLIKAKEIIYPRLFSSKSQANFCPTSSALGEQMGRALTLNPTVSASKQSGLFLT